MERYIEPSTVEPINESGQSNRLSFRHRSRSMVSIGAWSVWAANATEIGIKVTISVDSWTTGISSRLTILPPHSSLQMRFILCTIRFRTYLVFFAHGGVRKLVSIGIEHWNYHPVVILGQIHDGRISGSEQLIQKIRGCGHSNPFAGMDCRFNENSWISLAKMWLLIIQFNKIELKIINSLVCVIISQRGSDDFRRWCQCYSLSTI